MGCFTRLQACNVQNAGRSPLSPHEAGKIACHTRSQAVSILDHVKTGSIAIRASQLKFLGRCHGRMRFIIDGANVYVDTLSEVRLPRTVRGPPCSGANLRSQFPAGLAYAQRSGLTCGAAVLAEGLICGAALPDRPGLYKSGDRGSLRGHKHEQAPYVSDILAHLAAASFASPGRCKQTRAGCELLGWEFPRPNGRTRKRTRIAKTVVDALGPKVAHPDLRRRAVEVPQHTPSLGSAEAAPAEVLRETLQALPQGMEKMYLADPAPGASRTCSAQATLFGARAATRPGEQPRLARSSSGGAQHAAAILEDPATTSASCHHKFEREVLRTLPCFGPYWSKYVYGDVAEHIAGARPSASPREPGEEGQGTSRPARLDRFGQPLCLRLRGGTSDASSRERPGACQEPVEGA